MRILGCGLLFLWGTLLGWRRKWSLEQQRCDWEQLLTFLQLVEEELRERCASCRDILLRVGQQCPDYPLAQVAKEEGDLRQQLLAAAEHLGAPELCRQAKRFALAFGASSAQSQLELLAQLQERCREEEGRQRELCQKQGTLALSLGCLLGAGAAIYFL